VSPQDSITVQAETEDEMREWIAIIQNATAYVLNSQETPRKVGIRAEPKSAATCATSTAAPAKHIAYELLREQECNRFCADCNARDPSWASINMGITICIECRYTIRYIARSAADRHMQS
jgi:Arf-GAP with coiled-coil, ANK repeat and PH domain-containing protein